AIGLEATAGTALFGVTGCGLKLGLVTMGAAEFKLGLFEPGLGFGLEELVVLTVCNPEGEGAPGWVFAVAGMAKGRSAFRGCRLLLNPGLCAKAPDDVGPVQQELRPRHNRQFSHPASANPLKTRAARTSPVGRRFFAIGLPLLRERIFH